MSTAILGLQWGDEGKGKITHLLAKNADVVVRFNGGPNAGHTVIDRGVKFGTHLIPAGAFYPNTLSVLSSGMVIDFAILREEWNMLSEHLGWHPRLLIAENAHVIMPYHRVLEELEGSGKHFGTTRRGIAPTYRDKSAKLGIRVGDLLRPDIALARLELRLSFLKREWPDAAEIQGLSAGSLLEEQLAIAAPLLSCIGNATETISHAMSNHQTVMFEGAQGTLLDVDHGSYPFVTSSSTTFAGLGNSIGIPNPQVDRRLGVFKAYMTRVGAGPFPTIVSGALEERLRTTGGEFGVTTGRPRECGWLDLVALRYAIQLNGCTGLAITKLDVLSGFDEVKVCRSYRLGGQLTDKFPLSAEVLERCEPEYDVVAGWDEPISQIRDESELPESVLAYIRLIERAVNVPIEVISVGPGPEATMVRN
ncbi:adenylosuccinate synthase [Candidatus Bipolaricaulota bacterium]|nr:adenylosuccinate synthase [Candidatus Bipolaricaulota bacterium]